MFWNWLTTIWFAGWVIPVVMLFIVPVNRKPSSATAWLMLLFLLPWLGLAIFLLLGNPKLSRRRRDEQRKMSELIGKVVAEARTHPESAAILAPAIPARDEPFVNLNANLSSLPAIGGNAVELLPEYNSVFARIAQDIDQAQHFVHVEYFTTSRDEETECVFAALERAAGRGVRVRMLMDHLGSRKYPNFKAMRERLTAAGIEHHLALPLHFFGARYTRIDLRNHRKIVVIDGQIGYTGSENLIKRNYFRKDAIYYDELVARIAGPAVSELEAAFATDWYSECGVLLTRQSAPEVAIELKAAGEVLCQVLPSGSGFEDENNLKLFTSLIHAARQRLVITNPYFVPDDALMTAMTSAAQRGVDVTLVNSEVSDQFLVSHAERSYYEDLLKAGVKVYQYGAPVLLHSKHITVDDDIAVIGSSNLDIRSFQLNLEVTLICYGESVVRDLRKVEASNLLRSKPVDLGEWEARSLK
ncbi:MAG: cardiolipin synthase [Acetobacteraceae bacterium]|nr:cardiolipin synthase [Acetobacteraceae bacterium]